MPAHNRPPFLLRSARIQEFTERRLLPRGLGGYLPFPPIRPRLLQTDQGLRQGTQGQLPFSFCFPAQPQQVHRPPHIKHGFPLPAQPQHTLDMGEIVEHPGKPGLWMECPVKIQLCQTGFLPFLPGLQKIRCGPGLIRQQQPLRQLQGLHCLAQPPI